MYKNHAQEALRTAYDDLDHKPVLCFFKMKKKQIHVCMPSTPSKISLARLFSFLKKYQFIIFFT